MPIQGGGAPPVVMATVVQATPVQYNNNNAGNNNNFPEPQKGQGRPQQPVMARVVEQQTMGQTTVVGQPVFVGSGGPGPQYGGPQYGGPQYGGQQYGGQMPQGQYAGYPGNPGMGDPTGYPAEDPTIPAVIACCCCCFCVGIIAIIKAQEVSMANREGNFHIAHAKRKEAMQWIYITVGTGIVFSITMFILRSTALGSSSGATADSGRKLMGL